MSRRAREASGDGSSGYGPDRRDESASAGPSRKNSPFFRVDSPHHASAEKRRRIGSASTSSKSKSRSISPVKRSTGISAAPGEAPPRGSSDIPLGSPSPSLAVSEQEDSAGMRHEVGAEDPVEDVPIPVLSAGTLEPVDVPSFTGGNVLAVDIEANSTRGELEEDGHEVEADTAPTEESGDKASNGPVDESRNQSTDRELDASENLGQLLTPPITAQGPASVSTLGVTDDNKVDPVPSLSEPHLPLVTPVSMAPTDAARDAAQDDGEEEVDPDRDMEVDPAPFAPEAASSVADSRSVSPSRAKPKPKAKSQTKKPAAKPPKETSKPKAPTKGAVKGTTRKVPAKKEKTKVESIKESSKRAGSSASPVPESQDTSEVTTPHRAESVDSEDDGVYCICRKPYKDEDEDVVMVACDGCDDWFHPGCVKIDESKLDLLDSYICAKCEKNTTLRTKYKRVCKRERCGKSLTGSGKYCSSACAFRHMAEQVPPTTNKKLLKQLSSVFVGLPAPKSNVSVTHHFDTHLTTSTTEQTTASLSEQISAINRALSDVTRRQEILQHTITRCETLILPAASEAEVGDKKSKKRPGGGDDRPCGWDKKLVWTDEEVEQWRPDEDDGMDGEACMAPKRRCDRHQGWQKTMTASLDLEAGQLVRRKGDLERQIRLQENQLGQLKAATKAELEFNERIGKIKVVKA